MQEPVQKVFTPATAVEMMGIRGLTRRVGVVPSLSPDRTVAVWTTATCAARRRERVPSWNLGTQSESGPTDWTSVVGSSEFDGGKASRTELGAFRGAEFFFSNELSAGDGQARAQFW